MLFMELSDHYWFWALPWKLGGKIKLNRMKFVLFLIFGYLCTNYGLGCFLAGWNGMKFTKSFRVG